jgi:CDP-diacylglycerol--serine O-phosphatidyltransferase
MKNTKKNQKHPKSLTHLTPADAVSMISAMLAFLSIIVIFRIGNYYIASLLLIVCVILDFLDGKVARAFGHANEFGKNIDSLVDVLCFGVAPAIFMQQFLSGVYVFLPCLIILGGIYRLARYNVSDNKDYIGMPITANGLIIPVIYLAGLFTPAALVVLSIVLPILMVSKIRIRKVI